MENLAPPSALSVTIHVTSESTEPEIQEDPSPLRRRNIPGSSSASSHSKDIEEQEKTAQFPSTSEWVVNRGVRADVQQLVLNFAQRSSSASSSSCDPCACTPDDGKADSSSSVDRVVASHLVNSLKSPGSSKDRIALVVCGPSSMAQDASNASASVQMNIVRGRLPGVREAYLLKEGFGW